MNATDQGNEETNDTSNDSEESSERTMQTRLRDLKPEKDPMGARNLDPQDSSTTH
jgi:hypothetical protein